MRAGLLRHRIEVQAATEAEDVHGGHSETWIPADTIWGSIEPLKGEELLEAQAVDVRVTHRVRMRYQPSGGLTAKKRLKFGTRIFNIISVLNTEERNWELTALCVESV